MAITLDHGEESDDNDRNSGADLSSLPSLFRVLIQEVKGVKQAQQDTKDLLSRSLAMKEAFTTNPKTKSEARKLREAVDNTEPASPRSSNRDEIGEESQRAVPNAPSKNTSDPTAGYVKQLKNNMGSPIPSSLKNASAKGVVQNFGLDLAHQLGDSARESVFQNWERRDQAQRARQRGYNVPASADDRTERPKGSNKPAAAPVEEVQGITRDRALGGGVTFKADKGYRKPPIVPEALEDDSYDYRRNQPTNGGNYGERINAAKTDSEEYKSPPPPSQGKTWGYNTASPGGPTGYTPGSSNGPYGPYGRYGTSSTTGGGGGGGGHDGGGGGGGGGSSSQNGSYGENTGIGGWAKRNIPGVGMLFGAADEVKSQRNKNAYYQNVEGGSNASGFAERAHEEAYAATAGGLFGAFSEKEAREAFKGVTRIGYNGKQGQDFSTQAGRQDALNYAYHGKTAYGADVSESLRQLEVASKDATINLNDLQKSMKGVSDSAGKAGVNAQMARQNLMNLIQTGQQNGMSGAAAQNIAQPIAQGQASMGRDFQGYNYSGQMSSSVQYIQAANAGISKGQLQQLATDNPLKYQQIVTGNKLQQLSNALPQEIQDAIKAALKDTPGTVDEPTARQIAQKILRQFPDYNNTAYWQGYIATTGADPNGNPLLWMTDAIMTIAGQDPQLQAAQKATSAQPQNLPGTTSKSQLPSGVTSSSQGYADDKTEKLWSKQQGESGHASVKALADEEKKGGRNRVLEGIMQNQPNADHTDVEVHTKDGARVVSLADAIKNHPEELSAGDVKFMSGANKGKTVSDVVGAGNVDSSADWKSESQKADDSGKSLKDYQKDHPDDSKGTGVGANGSVIIDLTAAAKQLLSISQTTGAAQAAGNGAPVTNDYSTNPSRNGQYGPQ